METTKEKIFNATVNFLKSHQYDQLTLLKIANAVNIGKSTVYDYFNSKEELIEETMFYLLNQYEQMLFKDSLKDNFDDEFSNHIRKIIHIFKEARVIAEALCIYPNHELMKSVKIQIKIRDFQLKYYKKLEDIFKLAVIEKKALSLYDQYQKHVVLSIINGLIYQYINNELIINLEDLIELIKKHCLNTINTINPI